jgi:small subunit ribosomal protein S13
MARIAGIDLPKNKRGVIGLTYIYGIGRSTSKKILNDNGIDENIKVQDWNDDQLGLLRTSINEVKTEGQLRSDLTFRTCVDANGCPKIMVGANKH